MHRREDDRKNPIRKMIFYTLMAFLEEMDNEEKDEQQRKYKIEKRFKRSTENCDE